MATPITIDLIIVEPIYLDIGVEPVNYIGTALAGPVGPPGPPGSSRDATNERFVLTADIIQRKYITIAGVITDNQSVRVFVDHIGLKAEQGVDFSFSGNDVFWTSYDFENKLEVGDVLHVFYS